LKVYGGGKGGGRNRKLTRVGRTTFLRYGGTKRQQRAIVHTSGKKKGKRELRSQKSGTHGGGRVSRVWRPSGRVPAAVGGYKRWEREGR